MAKSKFQRAKATTGRRPAAPMPSIEELLGVSTSRHEAYEQGHVAALCDELALALRVSYCSRHTNPQPDDPVTIPYWACLAVQNLATNALIDGTRGMGRHARWDRQYREKLIQWHRYAAVKTAIRDQRAKWPPGEPDVYKLVSRELEGTAFAARPSTVKKSYERVCDALTNGQQARFRRSSFDTMYDFLLRTPGPIVVKI